MDTREKAKKYFAKGGKSVEDRVRGGRGDRCAPPRELQKEYSRKRDRKTTGMINVDRIVNKIKMRRMRNRYGVRKEKASRST